MPDFMQMPLFSAVGLFLLAAGIITAAGIKMAETADRLADRTGLGEALFGAVLLGGSTSIPGIVTSAATAAQGYPELAFSNAVGGIAAQTFFLALADIAYRRANLEHAAASLTNMAHAGLLIFLLVLPLLGAFLPASTLFGVHPVSFAIFLGYLGGVWVARRTAEEPMWRATKTRETKEDVAKEPKGGKRTLHILFSRFIGLAVLLGLAGYITAETGVAFAVRTGLTETVVGALLTAVSTSIPELVTTLAAVRRGALTLAVGGIIGGNMFDTLFIASADVAYREGSLYHTVSNLPFLLTVACILMTTFLLVGMLRREKYGIAHIGFESALVFLLYVGTLLYIVFGA